MFSLFCLFLLVLSNIKLDNNSIFLKSVLKLYFKHFYLKLLNSCLYEKNLCWRHTEVYVLWSCELKSGCLVLKTFS